MFTTVCLIRKITVYCLIMCTYLFCVIQEFLVSFCDRLKAKNAQSVTFIIHQFMIIGPQPYNRIMYRVCHRSLSGQNDGRHYCYHTCGLVKIVK